MRLHLAAGRREAALAQYKRCRELLQRELGLAPMAATEALAEQAARAAPAPSAPATPAAGAGAAAGQPVEWPAELPLTGRDEAWAALQAAWDRHRVMLVEGKVTLQLPLAETVAGKVTSPHFTITVDPAWVVPVMVMPFPASVALTTLSVAIAPGAKATEVKVSTRN